jgi:hypothetical protein
MGGAEARLAQASILKGKLRPKLKFLGLIYGKTGIFLCKTEILPGL